MKFGSDLKYKQNTIELYRFRHKEFESDSLNLEINFRNLKFHFHIDRMKYIPLAFTFNFFNFRGV